jgi:nicotinamidase/pyrazinamidase
MKVLLLVDLQRDFMPWGSLPVKDANQVIPIANKLINSGKFDLIIATQDCHPADHCSFKSWPIHCVAGESGSDLVGTLQVDKVGLILRKGMKQDVDSYSAFYDNAEHNTGLVGFICGIRPGCDPDVYIMGVATDYCIRATALDSVGWFNTFVISDGCRAVGDGAATFKELEVEGCKIITSDEV